jgi:hypothetical protein
VGPTLLASVVVGALLVLRGPDRAFVLAVTALFGMALVWVLVSVFWPARADRTCPACGANAIRRLDPASTRGIACGACEFRDLEHSSFLLAEEEGVPLESIRIDDRARGRETSR